MKQLTLEQAAGYIQQTTAPHIFNLSGNAIEGLSTPFGFIVQSPLTSQNSSMNRYKAVVDWAEFEICTAKPTNFWTVQKALQKIQGLPDDVNPYVAGYDESTGMAFPLKRRNTPTTMFRFRIQDPVRFHVVGRILEEIKNCFDLQNAPTPTAIEIALDASHATPEQAARFYKFASFMASENRRFYRGKYDTVQGIPRNFNSSIRLLSEGWQIGIGNKDADCYQHIYWKTTDNNGKPIPESEYRARIEITLRGAALPCKTLEDLARLNFNEFNKFFQFQKLKPNLEPMYQAVDKATDQIGERRKRKHREGGTRLHSKIVQADVALNGRARDALKELTRRWQRTTKTLPKLH